MTTNENLAPVIAPENKLNPGDLIRWNTIEGEFVGFLASIDGLEAHCVEADGTLHTVGVFVVNPR